MKSKTGTILMISGAMLIAAALSLAVYNIYDDKSAGEYSQKILMELEAELPELNRADEIPNEYSIYEIPSDTQTENITIDNNDYIGIIDIPVLNIKLPVMAEWNYDNLKLSPCRYKGSVFDNSLIIAAHNYSSHFGSIKELNQGNEVYFIDVNGTVHSYTVYETEIINGSDVDSMTSGDWDLTLFTCNFDGTNRVTVRCVKK